jgi:hypothetical protein
VAPALGGVVAAAERALAQQWRCDVGLLPLNPGAAVRPHSTVVRCLVRTESADAPVTVIVKALRDYDVLHVSPEAPAGRFLNEWAALRLLSEFGTDAAPRPLAGDRDLGVLVLEDLGSGASLQDVLDSGPADAAVIALNAYATGLGRLHALSIGAFGHFESIRTDLGLPAAAADPFVSRWSARNLPVLPSLCADLGCGWSHQAQQELDSTVQAIAEPGPWQALSQGDTCPENHRLAGNTIRFLDFEYCGFRHALLDAAFLALPFPTCQHVRRLPAAAVEPALELYRSQLASGCTAASDDALWRANMLRARAWWTMLSLGAYLRQALEADRVIGSTSMRQRLLLWLETFISDSASGLPALHSVAAEVRTLLRGRWGPEAESPVFTAFQPR